jgi:hypothetical protein
MSTPESYPIQFSVEYPEDERNRTTVFFRIFMIIPIAIVLGLLSNSGTGGGFDRWDGGGQWWFSGGGVGVLALPPLLMILFRQKYPRWWFDWNLEISRFSNRVFAYLFLLRDEYPATDEQQAVHLEIPYPDVERDLNRWLPLVKWLLAIPHYIVLFFLAIAAFFVIIFAWFAILFTGRYPDGLFDFVVGVMRWGNRVTGYAFIMATDQYPPFSLK